MVSVSRLEVVFSKSNVFFDGVIVVIRQEMQPLPQRKIPNHLPT